MRPLAADAVQGDAVRNKRGSGHTEAVSAKHTLSKTSPPTPDLTDPWQGLDGASRPVWLLREPRPLADRNDQPLLEGAPLKLLCGPERIESGWWDGALAQRDYFIAQRADGTLVWVFRGRLPLATDGDIQGWYLQGLFG